MSEWDDPAKMSKPLPPDLARLFPREYLDDAPAAALGGRPFVPPPHWASIEEARTLVPVLEAMGLDAGRATALHAHTLAVLLKQAGWTKRTEDRT